MGQVRKGRYKKYFTTMDGFVRVEFSESYCGKSGKMYHHGMTDIESDYNHDT